MSKHEADKAAVALVISGLAACGAERVICHMAGFWAAREQEVTVITFDPTGTTPFFPLHPDVRLVQLGLLRPARGPFDALAANARRVRALRRALDQSGADVVIAFTSRVNVLTILAAQKLGKPVIVSERVNPLAVPKSALQAALERWLYPRADRLVVQTARAMKCFAPRVQERTAVIPNPVMIPGQHHPAEKQRGRYILMGMGRFEAQKAHDELLHAFSALAAVHPDWDLEIWGEGPERPRLLSLVAELDLQERVRLPGRTADSVGRLQTAHLFALTSLFEGFPNVLLEAMASGVPAVSYDAPFGPREVIRDGVDGLLVPPGDRPGLVAALGRLMGDDGERARLAARAIETRERFHLSRIMAQWDELVGSLLPAREPNVEVTEHEQLSQAYQGSSVQENR